jgi:hypothetical protein
MAITITFMDVIAGVLLAGLALLILWSVAVLLYHAHRLRVRLQMRAIRKLLEREIRK